MTKVIDDASAGLARVQEARRSKAAALALLAGELEGVQMALAGCASAPQRMAELEMQAAELQRRLNDKQAGACFPTPSSSFLLPTTMAMGYQ